MNCKYCGAELEDGVLLCPECGKSQEEAEVFEDVACADETELTEQTEAAEEELEEAAASAETAEAEEEAAEEKPELSPEQKRQKKKTKILVAAVAVLGVLVVTLGTLLLAPKIAEWLEKQEAVQEQKAEEARLAALPSYYAEEDELTDEVLETAVATCGNDSVTNRDFAFYYWEQYRIFLNSYGQYVSYMLDSSKGLDKQEYDDNQTWQQVFMEGAAAMYQSVSACAQEAEKTGFALAEQTQKSIDNMAEGLEETAKSYGYESAEDYLVTNYGVGCTVENYVEFVRRMQIAREYLIHLVDESGYTDEDISKYYDEHAEDYEQSGIVKVDKPTVAVRHILITPEETDDDGNYTDEAWKAAEAKINEILAEFDSGARNEERFSALAETYSTDPGSASDGGLYEDVFPGQMVEEFNDWCFADGRKEGDYGIVKTEYGYHLIYFVTQNEEVYWYETAKTDYRNELSTKVEEEISARYEKTYDEEKVRIFDVTKEQREAAAQAG